MGPIKQKFACALYPRSTCASARIELQLPDSKHTHTHNTQHTKATISVFLADIICILFINKIEYIISIIYTRIIIIFSRK